MPLARSRPSLIGAAALACALGAVTVAQARAADGGDTPFRVAFHPAPPIALHDAGLAKSDSNSPVHWDGNRLVVFVSHWLPRGHSYRRVGTALGALGPRAQPIRIVNDPSPDIGKWLEATWRDADGTLYGWYHAEAPAPCEGDIKLPFIGAMTSADQGAHWTDLGPIITAPAGQHDCAMQNGFFAGGVGDFSVIADRNQGFFYVFFTNYDRRLPQQGIAVARLPFAARHQPAGALRKWDGAAWRQPGLGGTTRPILAARRGWRHPDPDSFWGPAIHWNGYLGGFVMALNRTANGDGDWPQEGVYLSFAAGLDRPSSWTIPLKIVAGGEWYPQIIGTAPGQTDREAGRRARLFMAGYSEWEVEFTRTERGHGGASAAVSARRTDRGAAHYGRSRRVAR
ncbi:MAG: hypothetical protein AB7P12_16870 [Alphaproteobacteria bacterium]